jgi:protein-tyrosine phosphatase
MVCTGNLCRSPMAEALLRTALSARGCHGVQISSAGTWAGGGSPATTEAIAAVRARSGDLSSHRSSALTAEAVEAADLVIAMTSVHVREILELAPHAEGKLVLLNELLEMEPDFDEGAGQPSQRLEALLASPRSPSRRSLDVDDPIGLGARAYDRCATEIERGVRRLASLLYPPEGSG